MASTNKTEFYDLSQYVASDKPTYLTDYNNDMDIIDGAIHSVDVKAGVAETKADSADTKADNAQTTATEALNSAGSANTNIGTMANLDTTNKSTLVGAINEVNDKANDNDSKISNFNLTNFTNYGQNDMTFTNCTAISGQTDLTVATNSDGSLAKIYGHVFVNKTSNVTGYVSIQTSLRPDTDITINPIGITQHVNSKSIWYISLTIRTTGEVVINYPVIGAGDQYAIFIPTLLFVKDFGDTPAN